MTKVIGDPGFKGSNLPSSHPHWSEGPVWKAALTPGVVSSVEGVGSSDVVVKGTETSLSTTKKVILCKNATGQTEFLVVFRF